VGIPGAIDLIASAIKVSPILPTTAILFLAVKLSTNAYQTNLQMPQRSRTISHNTEHLSMAWSSYTLSFYARNLPEAMEEKIFHPDD